MPKHSFNADDHVEGILATVERVLRDKTEFINRVIALHGRATIHTIMQERQHALKTSILQDATTTAMLPDAKPDKAPYKISRKRKEKVA